MTAVHAWHRITFGQGRTKTHTAPGCLLADLIDDLRKRGHEPAPILRPPCDGDVEIEYRSPVLRTRMWCLDMGGMVCTDEPWITVRVDNLPIEVRACDVRDHVQRLARYEVRRFSSGRAYYKIHGWMHCIVLLPRQFRAFTAGVEASVEHAEAESAAFWRGKKTWNDALREANARAIGAPIESMPRLAGAHPADRFTFPPDEAAS